MRRAPLQPVNSQDGLSDAGYDEGDEKLREEFYKRLGLRHFGRMRVDETWSLWAAYALVFFASTGGLLFFYAAFLSKYMPDTGFWLLDEMKRDEYICFFIPLMAVPTVGTIYLNWLSMKLYEAH